MITAVRISRNLAAVAFAAALFTPRSAWAQGADVDPWSRLPGILAGIKAPAFPARDCPVSAKADGATDITDAIRKAIDECAAKGGGRVVIPAGEYLTGPIHLKSGVNLHVQKGATLRFSTDPARYLPVVKTRFEGVEVMNYSPLIYGGGQENPREKRRRAITETGKIRADGAGCETRRGSGGAERVIYLRHLHPISPACHRRSRFDGRFAGVGA